MKSSRCRNLGQNKTNDQTRPLCHNHDVIAVLKNYVTAFLNYNYWFGVWLSGQTVNAWIDICPYIKVHKAKTMKQCWSSVFSVQQKILSQIKLTTTISWKPVRTKFLSNSQPMPPAPTTSNLQDKTFLLDGSPSTPKLAAIVL